MSSSSSALPANLQHEHIKCTLPRPSILLITLTRPTHHNAVTASMHHHLSHILTFYDSAPWLRSCVLTGSGRNFCAGADLAEWLSRNQGQSARPASPGRSSPATMPSTGFLALSNRTCGKKPIIAAVHGACLGGGFEAVIGGCDLVVAGRSARFGLPEAKRGVVAIAGALPRLVRDVGWKRASEVALAGKVLSAEEAREWGLVMKVVDEERVVDDAVKVAEYIAGLSPDSVIVTREGLLSGSDGCVEATSRVMESKAWRGLEEGENIKEGLNAFLEKRDPVWKDSKL